MAIPSLLAFALEDFFDQYEHKGDLINLASSDCLPWSIADLQRKGVSPLPSDTCLQYPDPRPLVRGLQQLCQPPPGIGVLPTSGAAEAMALVMHELSTADGASTDRPVGIPRPAFGAFHGLASMLGLATEFYDYDPTRGWTPDLDEIRKLARRCRALVVISPHNPTGYVIPDDALSRIAGEMAATRGILIVNEVFRTPGESGSAIQLGSHVVVIGSLSKMYGLPGLRLGWVAAADARLRRLRTIQQYLTLSPGTMAVTLGAEILEDPEAFIRTDLIRVNRGIVKAWVDRQGEAVSISRCDGGTTACLTVNSAKSERDLFDAFVQAGVLLVPGTQSFHCRLPSPWFRLGYGTDSARLQQGLDRVTSVIASLK